MVIPDFLERLRLIDFKVCVIYRRQAIVSNVAFEMLLPKNLGEGRIPGSVSMVTTRARGYGSASAILRTEILTFSFLMKLRCWFPTSTTPTDSSRVG